MTKNDTFKTLKNELINFLLSKPVPNLDAQRSYIQCFVTKHFPTLNNLDNAVMINYLVDFANSFITCVCLMEDFEIDCFKYVLGYNLYGYEQ